MGAMKGASALLIKLVSAGATSLAFLRRILFFVVLNQRLCLRCEEDASIFCRVFIDAH